MRAAIKKTLAVKTMTCYNQSDTQEFSCSGDIVPSFFWRATRGATAFQPPRSTVRDDCFMPARTDDRSDGYFAPPQVATGELRRAVLVVAAGRMQADSLRHQLTSHGATVHVSRSVTEAFDRLPAEGYDAVVVDWETLEVEF